MKSRLSTVALGALALLCLFGQAKSASAAWTAGNVYLETINIDATYGQGSDNGFSSLSDRCEARSATDIIAPDSSGEAVSQATYGRVYTKTGTPPDYTVGRGFTAEAYASAFAGMMGYGYGESWSLSSAANFGSNSIRTANIAENPGGTANPTPVIASVTDSDVISISTIFKIGVQNTSWASRTNNPGAYGHGLGVATGTWSTP